MQSVRSRGCLSVARCRAGMEAIRPTAPGQARRPSSEAGAEACAGPRSGDLAPSIFGAVCRSLAGRADAASLRRASPNRHDGKLESERLGIAS